MKLFNTPRGIVVANDDAHVLLRDMDWDTFVNDDNLFRRCADYLRDGEATAYVPDTDLLPPIHGQELWASGVTYYRSKVGREEEAKEAGGGDFYARVYEAERPELFFKGTLTRVVGPGGKVRIRRDSDWNVPEPELTLVVTSSGKIVGYTIGNDMSSRSIEGENPLYLPQAKTYDGSAAVGPCIYVSEAPLSPDTVISLRVQRAGVTAFEGATKIDQIRRGLDELVSFLYRECSFPKGCLLMTGTGIVPDSDFTLRSGDEIAITIEPIGTLVNTVA